MFQNSVAVPNDLESILKLELDYFNSVLSISEKVVKQIEALPVTVLTEMVNYRKEWIGKIQKLEDQRKQIDKGKRNAKEQQYMENISDLAGKLVKIDDKIYKNLEKRKLQYVEQSAAIAGQSNYSRKQSRNSSNSSQIDIIQE